jgi:hypothetical protein
MLPSARSSTSGVHVTTVPGGADFRHSNGHHDASLRIFTNGFQHCTQRDRAHAAATAMRLGSRRNARAASGPY